MKRFIVALILIPSIIFQVGMRIGVVAHYSLNKKFITEAFCVNKDKPQLNCNGKCYLAQKLKEVEKKETSEVPFKSEVETLAFQNHTDLLSSPIRFFSIVGWVPISELYGKFIVFERVKPPCA